jgi:D-inositol-3-phosphate glycosyltransferase
MKIFCLDISGKGGISHFINLLYNSMLKHESDIAIITTRNSENINKEKIKKFNILYSHHQFKSFKIKGLIYLFSLGKLFFFLLRTRPAVVHWHEIKIPTVEYHFIKFLQKLNIKVLLSAHDVMHFEKGRATKSLANLYRSFDHIIAHAKSNRQMIIEQFKVYPDKVTVIPHGEYSGLATEYLSKTRARELLNINPSNRVLLFFGYIRTYKGLYLLLDAFADSLKRIPNAHLIIAGQPQENFEPYMEKIRRHNLQNHISLHLEYIPNEKISQFFSASDIVVLPYIKIYQSGIVYLAFGNKRPVIATDVGGLPEIVQNNKNGYLIPANDQNALVSTLIKALSEIDLLEKMGEYAYIDSKDRYSWDKIAERIYSITKSLDQSGSQSK